MRTKSLVLLIIAIGCGAVASVAVSQVIMDQGDGNTVRTVGIVVTAKDVSPMTKLAEEMVKVEQWPADRVPMGALTDVKEIDGKFAKQRLYTGEPVIEAKLSLRGKDLVVPVGFRIFDLKVDDSNGGSGYIGPGDRVDVTGFFEKSNRFPVSKSVRVMRNVEVAMVDGISFRDPEAAQKKASTIQLLVQDKQYEALDTACNSGKLKLSLRAPDGEAKKDGEEAIDDGESFLKWLKDNETSQDRTANKTPAVESLNLIKGVLGAMQPNPQVEARKEMTILTPGSMSVYRWVNGRKMPVLMTPEEYYQAPDQSPNVDGGPHEGPMQFPPFGGSSPFISTPLHSPASPTLEGNPSARKDSGKGQAAPGFANGTGAGTVGAGAPTPVWDSNSGTWQSGGFKPVYP
jgi:pilus assembly protein CpaB